MLTEVVELRYVTIINVSEIMVYYAKQGKVAKSIHNRPY